MRISDDKQRREFGFEAASRGYYDSEKREDKHTMLFDTHTNLMWYPDHYSDEFVEFAWAAKKAKMRITPDVYFAGAETPQKNAFDSTPEALLKASHA